MTIDLRARKPARSDELVDLAKLVTTYYHVRPDPSVSAQRVAFGTSGHRGSSFDASFDEAHVLAIADLFAARTAWPAHTAVGKTVVTTWLIDRVDATLDRSLREVPVGFNRVFDGLFDDRAASAARSA